MAQMPAADQGVEELRQRVGRLSRLFDRILDQVADAAEVSRADWAALSVVIRGDRPCAPTELARELGLTSGTVSTRIKRLTEAGLIENAADAGGDARSRPVRATEAGYELWATATAERTRRETATVRAVFDDDGLAATNARLAELLTGLERDLGRGPKHDVPGMSRPAVGER